MKFSRRLKSYKMFLPPFHCWLRFSLPFSARECNFDVAKCTVWVYVSYVLLPTNGSNSPFVVDNWQIEWVCPCGIPFTKTSSDTTSYKNVKRQIPRTTKLSTYRIRFWSFGANTPRSFHKTVVNFCENNFEKKHIP